MKLWIDDVRPAPEGYLWIRSVNEAEGFISLYWNDISLIDLDHDAGDYADEGGDYINVLNFIERMANINEDRTLPFSFHFHSMNPVGVQNMRRIIESNGWKEKLYI